MRIGIDTRVLSWSICGLTRYAVNLIAALGALDTENEYVLFSDKPCAYPLPQQPNITQRVIPASNMFIWEEVALPQALRREEIDLFHCLKNYGISRRKQQWKVVVTVHDIIPYLFNEFWIDRPWIRKFAYRQALRTAIVRADRIITVSESSKKDLMQVMRVGADKISVIYQGINGLFAARTDPRREVDVVRSMGIHGSYILHVTGMGFNKNTETVLHAYERMSRQLPTPPQLVVAGDASYIRGRISALKIATQGVIFTGLISDETLSTLYRGARVMVYPSLYEGFGLPVLEAMASGTPVIISRVASLPEVAADAALYVQPREPDELSLRLIEVLTDEDLRQQLIVKGQERVRWFSWYKTAEQVLGVYHGVVG